MRQICLQEGNGAGSYNGHARQEEDPEAVGRDKVIKKSQKTEGRPEGINLDGECLQVPQNEIRCLPIQQETCMCPLAQGRSPEDCCSVH